MTIAQRQLPNTLNLAATAIAAVDLTSLADAKEAIFYAENAGIRLRCLGEGSNVVLMPKVAGLVCYVKDASVTLLSRDDEFVRIKVGAGKNWHELVEETLSQGWFGLENLSLIPGSVGAAPIQNIGAYGVEVAQFIESVAVMEANQIVREMPAKECAFAYRDSIFKARLKSTANAPVILSVTFCLNRRPDVNLSYAELAAFFEFKSPYAAKPKSKLPSPEQVADAVTAIRRAKLPDPREYPNAGSFFKNPRINAYSTPRLEARSVRPYKFGEGYKVSAAQLIDHAGWKGKRRGDVGCWANQPLVLVNYGRASASNLLAFAQEVRQSVAEQFQIQLELEPSVVS